MSTELEPYAGPREVEPIRPPVDSWTEVFRPIVALAEHVAGTEFVPRGLRGSPPAAAAAMLYGRELGMGPMRSLQNVYVIDGTPTLKPQEMRAMVLAAGHSLRWGERTKVRCVLAGRRRGETEWTTAEWTLQDARDLNLTHKPNWKRMPRQMLVARVTGELCRLIFPDVIGGAYTPEEIADGGAIDLPTDLAPVAPDQPAPRRAKRKTPVKTSDPTPPAAPDGTEPAPVAPQEDTVPDGPPLPDEISDTELVEETAPNGVSEGQLKRLHAFFSEHEITDRAYKLDIARAITGRPDLASSTELTSREASQLIDTLARLDAQAGGEFLRALDVLITELGARIITDPDAEAGGPAGPEPDTTTEETTR